MLFFSLLLTLELQPRKCTPSFPFRKILLLLFLLHLFFFIFFLMITCHILSVLFLRWYLSPWYLLPLLITKWKLICLFPLKLRKDLSSVMFFLKKKPTNQLYWFGKDSLLHLWRFSPVLFLGLTVFWSISLAAVMCSLTLSHPQWFGSKSVWWMSHGELETRVNTWSPPHSPSTL